MPKSTILSDFLAALAVPHTRRYSDKRFNSLTFHSLFGLSRLLDEYGVPNAAWNVPKQGSISKIRTPFLAQRPGNFVIVSKIADGSVDYIYNSARYTTPIDEFERNWTGIVLTAEPKANAHEPDVVRHRLLDTARAALNWIMTLSVLAILAYLYISREFYLSAGLTSLILVDLAGVCVTSMLMLKSVNVHTIAADRVCGILQRGGCDKILAMDASKFFGLFGWSEVGLGYFSVSTACLLLFPGYLHWLALANLCCLPFTFWSIWYQRFRAHHWCTLCVITQSLLWLQFICYLVSRNENHFTLLCPQPWILACCYIASVLILNKVADMLTSK